MRTVIPPQFSLEDLQGLLTIALTEPVTDDDTSRQPETTEGSDSWDVSSW